MTQVMGLGPFSDDDLALIREIASHRELGTGVSESLQAFLRGRGMADLTLHTTADQKQLLVVLAAKHNRTLAFG